MAALAVSHRPPSATGALPLQGAHETLARATTADRTLASKANSVARRVLTHKQAEELFPGIPRYVIRSASHIPSGGPEGSCLMEYLYAHGDVGCVTRYSEDFVAAIQTHNGHAGPGFGLGPHAYATLGLTSTSSLATGAIAGAAGLHQYREGVRTGDDTGYRIGVLGILRGILEVMSGAVFTGFRVLSLIPTAAAGAVSAVGAAGVIGYIGVYLTMAATFGYAAHDIRMTWQKLETEQTKSPEAAYKLLHESVTLDKKDIDTAFKLIEKDLKHGIGADDQKKLLQGYKAMRMGLLDAPGFPKDLAVRFEMLRKACPEETWDALDKELRTKSHPYHRANNAAKVLDHLFNLMDKKHGEIGRAVGSGVVNRVLNHGANPAATVKKAIVDQAMQKTSKHFWLYFTLSAVCVFGAAAFALSMVFTGGVPHIIIAGAMLATGLMMTGIDGYFLVEALKNKRPANWEKIAMWVLSIGFIAASVAATLMSGGILPIAILSTVSVLWILLFITTQVKWNQPHETKHRYDEDIRIGAPAAGI